MEPASSSDDDSSIEEIPTKRSRVENDDEVSSSEEDSEVDGSDDEGDGDTRPREPTSFDDLPSEDSCLDDSESDSESHGEDKEEMALGDMVQAKESQGRRRNPSKAAAKGKALEIAQRRLAEMKANKLDSSNSSNTKARIETNDYIKKKKSKHAPTSASSKRTSFFQRGAPDLNSSGIGVEIGANRYKPRDPRQQSLSGHLDQTVFEKRYGFLEEIQDKEIEATKQRCRAWKATGKKGQKLRRKLGLTSGENNAEEDQAELTRLLQERSGRIDSKVKTAAKRAVKKKLQEDVASGKRGAYYLKKRDMKKMELEAKFEELKKLGGDKKVNEVMAKRRKRKMGKDSAFMPSSV